MSKKKNLNHAKSSGVLLDCKSPEQSGVHYSFEHAEKLLNLQVAKGWDHWRLTEGQGLIFDNGRIDITTGSGDISPGAE